jgi:hypothetical protein
MKSGAVGAKDKIRLDHHLTAPRLFYRPNYNVCDKQNRSLRLVGAAHNRTETFVIGFLRLMVEITPNVFILFLKGRRSPHLRFP